MFFWNSQARSGGLKTSWAHSLQIPGLPLDEPLCTALPTLPEAQHPALATRGQTTGPRRPQFHSRPNPAHQQANTSFGIPLNPIPNCVGNSLIHAAIFQDPALSTSSPALAPWAGCSQQCRGNSPRVFWTLTPPTSEQALPRIPLSSADSRLGPTNQQLAHLHKTAWQPTKLANQAYEIAHAVSRSQQKDHTAFLGETPRIL